MLIDFLTAERNLGKAKEKPLPKLHKDHGRSMCVHGDISPMMCNLCRSEKMKTTSNL